MKSMRKAVAGLMVAAMLLTQTVPVSATALSQDVASTETVTEEVTEVTTEAATETVTEATTAATIEASTEAVTEATTEAVATEQAKEKKPEEKTITEPEEITFDVFPDKREFYVLERTAIRKEADQEAETAEWLEDGDSITVTAQSDDWYKVIYGEPEQNGYVERDDRISEDPPVQTYAMPRMMMAKASFEDYPATGTVLCEGSWGGGYIWYVYQGPKASPIQHYVFCLDHGATMDSGKYKFTNKSGMYGSAKSTFRIAVAMDYFKKHSGWSDNSGYATGQYVVWNSGGNQEAKKLLGYIDKYWELTQVNPDRQKSKSSYDGTYIKEISESSATNKSKLQNLCKSGFKNNEKKYLDAAITPSNGYDVVNQKVGISGKAWKYFAAGADGLGDIEVAGIYDYKGNKLKDSQAKVAVASNGSLNVSYSFGGFDSNGKPLRGGEDNPLTIIMKVNGKYQGASSIDYLQTSSGKQNMSFDASFSSPAYFAVQVWSKIENEDGAKIGITKVDDLGNKVEGAEFKCVGYDANEKIVYPECKLVVTEDDPVFKDKITTPGTYYIYETKTVDGMTGAGLKAIVTATAKVENGVRKIILSNASNAAGVTFNGSAAGDEMTYSYTVTNGYDSGSAHLHKVANIKYNYEDDQFGDKTRPLDGVEFKLYTNEDIYLGDQLLWTADTQITQDMLNTSVWKTTVTAGKNAAVDMVTNITGDWTCKNLPVGKYYVMEGENPHNKNGHGYFTPAGKIEFDITAGQDTTIKSGGDNVVNEEITASVAVVKIDADETAGNDTADPNDPYKNCKRLPGAEFTLYAHISNKNLDGGYFYTADQTVPAVVSRKNGKETVVANEWIPIDTAVSDEDGIADFGKKIPYGKYMVVETAAPYGYGLAEGDSKIFVHEYNKNESYANGKVFSYMISDKKLTRTITVKKYGSLLTGAENASGAYGSYADLIYQEVSAKDVTFGIYDAAGKLVEEMVTDENGTATSGNLQPGTYTIREISNKNPELVLSDETQEVTFDNDNNKAQVNKQVTFHNRHVKTDINVYKQAEQAVRSGSGYTYQNVPVKGVVFGLFTGADIRNYAGKVIVKKGSCMGYAVTDENGKAAFSGDLPDGAYYVRELKTADDSRYILDDKKYDVKVAHQGDLTLEYNKNNPIINRLAKGRIQVIKTNEDGEIRLKGVKFLLFDSDNELVGEYVTDENGEIEIKDLPVGTYYLQETETLDNYKMDDEIHTIDLTKEDLEQVVVIKNEKEADTWVSIVTNHTLHGSGGVKTGDVINMMIRLLAILMSFMAAGFFFFRKKENRAALKHLCKGRLLALLLIAGVVTGTMAPCQVKAASDALQDGYIFAGDMTGTVKVTGSQQTEMIEYSNILYRKDGVIYAVGCKEYGSWKPLSYITRNGYSYSKIGFVTKDSKGGLIPGIESMQVEVEELKSYMTYNIGLMFVGNLSRTDVVLTDKITLPAISNTNIYNGMLMNETQNVPYFEEQDKTISVLKGEADVCGFLSSGLLNVKNNNMNNGNANSPYTVTTAGTGKGTYMMHGDVSSYNIDLTEQERNIVDIGAGTISDYGTSHKKRIYLKNGGTIYDSIKILNGEQYVGINEIGDIPENTEVKLLGKSKNWYCVSYNGLTGFVQRDYSASDADDSELLITGRTRCFYNSAYNTPANAERFGLTYYTGTIRFNTKGGTLSAAGSQYIRYKDYTDPLPAPEKENYRFTGWYTDPNCYTNTLVTSLTSAQTASETITLYAGWEIYIPLTRNGVNYIVTADGRASVVAGSYSGIVNLVSELTYKGKTYPVVTIASGAFANCQIDSLSIPASITTVEAGAFEGASVGKIRNESTSLSLSNFPKSFDLVTPYDSVAAGEYAAGGYTGSLDYPKLKIDYRLDGGKNADSNPEYYIIGSEVTLQPAVKDGYTFEGWYTNPNLGDKSKIDVITDADPDEDIILYAKWTKSTVNDNTVVDNQDQNRNQTQISAAGRPKITAKNMKGKKLSVTISGTAKCFELQYGTSKKFKKAKKVILTKKSYTKKLKKGKTYYVRVRGYNLKNGKKLYSAWSNVKKVKIKK